MCGLALISFASVAFASRIANLSTRANVGLGDNVVIAGVIIQGYGSETLVFRGIGPSLPFDNDLPNPVLELHDSNGYLIFQNDNWQDTQGDEISATGLAPTNYLESAVKITLAPSSYTAILSCNGACTGIGLVEVYDITPQPSSARLANISTRAHAEYGNEKETAGMILQGSGNKSLLLRGIGPSLPFQDTLPNPFLQLYNSSGGLVTLNDNWKDSQQSQIAATGAAPTNDLESAMIVSVGPTSYTATVQDNSGATGIASIEVYDLDPAPTPPPQPTPTPAPLRLVWRDTYGGGSYVGYNSTYYPNDPTVELRRSGTLSAQGAGTIIVHFTGYAHGTCLYGCGGGGIKTSYQAELYPQLLNQNGTKVAEGTHIGFYGGQGDIPNSGTASFSWAGGPFIIRMMARSAAYFPEPDYVAVTYYDVYAP